MTWLWLAFSVITLSLLAVAGFMLLYLLALAIADRHDEYRHREQMRAIELREKQPHLFTMGSGPVS